jgi:hypothetical protein
MSEEEREYLNEMIRSLDNRLVDALRERDEARRKICEWISEGTPCDPKVIANRFGYDCFKEDGK